MEKEYIQESELFTYRSQTSGKFGISSDKQQIIDGLATGAIFDSRQEAIEKGLIRINRLLNAVMNRMIEAEDKIAELEG